MNLSEEDRKLIERGKDEAYREIHDLIWTKTPINSDPLQMIDNIRTIIIKARPKAFIKQLLKIAGGHTATAEEHRQQVISFAYGNLRLSNIPTSKEDIAAVYDELFPVVTT